MDNQKMLSQTIQFQRTAWQNSMAIFSAVQQHGEELLKTTIQQSPWLPGSSKKACLLWADIWTKNLAGMTELVEQNLANMERLSSTAGQTIKKEKPLKRATAKPQPSPQPKAAARKVTAEKKTAAPIPPAAEKQMPPAPAKSTVDPAVMIKAAAPQPLVTDQPLAKQPIVIEKPIGPKP
jgi:hypothetical protein